MYMFNNNRNYKTFTPFPSSPHQGKMPVDYIMTVIVIIIRCILSDRTEASPGWGSNFPRVLPQSGEATSPGRVLPQVGGNQSPGRGNPIPRSGETNPQVGEAISPGRGSNFLRSGKLLCRSDNNSSSSRNDIIDASNGRCDTYYLSGRCFL